MLTIAIIFRILKWCFLCHKEKQSIELMLFLIILKTDFKKIGYFGISKHTAYIPFQLTIFFPSLSLTHSPTKHLIFSMTQVTPLEKQIYLIIQHTAVVKVCVCFQALKHSGSVWRDSQGCTVKNNSTYVSFRKAESRKGERERSLIKSFM